MRQPEPWTTGNVVAALIIVAVLYLVAYLVSCHKDDVPRVTLPQALAHQPEPLPGDRLNPDSKDLAIAVLQHALTVNEVEYAQRVALLERELAESDHDRRWLLQHCEGQAWVDYQADRLGYRERGD